MEEIYRSITKDARVFTHGAINLNHEIVRVIDRDAKTYTNVGYADDLDVDKMLSFAKKSGYGDMKSKTTKYDDTVRNSFEIDVKNNVWNKFNFDPSYLRDLFDPETIEIEPYKFTIYKEGGFFQKHKDSCEGPELLGSIVEMYKPAEEGGELIVDGEKVELESPGSWVFFYGDVDHEIKPVTKGVRIALIYRVYASEGPKTSLKRLRRMDVDGRIELLLKMIEKDEDVNGFVTRHHYGGIASKKQLKGVDKTFYDAAINRGLNVKISPIHVRSEPIDVDDTPSEDEIDHDNMFGDDYDDIDCLIEPADNITKTWFIDEKDTEYSGFTGNEASEKSVLYTSLILIITKP